MLNIEQLEVDDWGEEIKDVALTAEQNKQLSISAYYVDRWYKQVEAFTFATKFYSVKSCAS